jgi:hypothetical protein
MLLSGSKMRWLAPLVLTCLGLSACDDGHDSSLSHPAASLPEACHSVIHWPERPDTATLALLRTLRDKGGDEVGVPDIFFDGPGVLGIYTDPKEGWSSRLAFVDLSQDAKPDLESLRTTLPVDFVLELADRRLWLLPKQLEGFSTSSATRLSAQPWLANSLAGFPSDQAGSQAKGLDLHFDLSRLIDLARFNADKDDKQVLDLLVGIDSFLSLGMRILPHAEKGQGKIDLYFRLSRTPDGIAAALDVVPKDDLLARLLPVLPEDAGYLLMNFRVATMTDALKAKVFGADSSGATEMVSMMSRSFAFILRGDLPRAFGNQWAVVDPEGKLSHGAPFEESGAYLLSTMDYSKKLGDTMSTLALAGNLTGLGPKVIYKRLDNGVLFETHLFGTDIVLVLGKRFGAISAKETQQTLFDLLAREAKALEAPPGTASTLPMPEGLPAMPEGAELRGRGAWSLDFLNAFLPAKTKSADPIRDFLEAMIAEGRRFRFQSLRVENGFLMQGRW